MRYGKGTWLLIVATLVVALAAGAGSPRPAAAQTTKITISEPIRVLPFAPLYVAVAKGFFRAEKIDVSILSGGGGTQATTAVVTGDAQFGVTASNELLTLVSKGQNFLAICGINTSLTMQTIVSKAYARKKGVSPKAPIRERIAALKGATMGGVSLGGSHEIFLRYNMVLGGLSPRDVTVVRVGGGPAMVAAMERGQVDGFIIGPPTGALVEQRGTGYIWINPSDLPQYKNMVWEVLFARGDYVKKNPELTRKVVRALARGINYIIGHPGEIPSLLKPYFKGLSVKTIQMGLSGILYAFRRDGRMNREMWDNAAKPLQVLKMVGKLNTKENGFWTNGYIANVPRD